MPVREFRGKFPSLEELIGAAIRPGVEYLYASVENMAAFQSEERGAWEMTRNPTTFSIDGHPAVLMCSGVPIGDVNADSMIPTTFVDNDLYTKVRPPVEPKNGKATEPAEPSSFISACGTPHPKGERSKRMHEINCRECQRILAERGE